MVSSLLVHILSVRWMAGFKMESLLLSSHWPQQNDTAFKIIIILKNAKCFFGDQICFMNIGFYQDSSLQWVLTYLNSSNEVTSSVKLNVLCVFQIIFDSQIYSMVRKQVHINNYTNKCKINIRKMWQMTVISHHKNLTNEQ